MAMTEAELAKITRYCDEHKIPYQRVRPKTATKSVEARPNGGGLTVQINDPDTLANFLKSVYDVAPSIIAKAIGGGRKNENNNSYSIGSLWEDTDIFIQLTGVPEIKQRPNEVKQEEKLELSRISTNTPSQQNLDDQSADSDISALSTFSPLPSPTSARAGHASINDEKKPDEVIVRVSPNMMLIEINKKLYEMNLHCPALVGALPFMSLGGGLSTVSHTAVSALADIVEGVEMVLPNGVKKYFGKNDPDFDLICHQPTFGLLGVMTNIDIKVMPEAKKLQREITNATWQKTIGTLFANQNKTPPTNCSILLSSLEPSKKSAAKKTTWQWVSKTAADENSPPVQRIVGGLPAVVAPKIARHAPGVMAALFNKNAINSDEGARVVASPHLIMGPESKLLTTITECGLSFEFTQMSDFISILQRLQLLLREHPKAVNTAIFMRFIEDDQTHKTKVCLDLASLEHHLLELEPCVSQLYDYLQEMKTSPQMHFGKSTAIDITQKNDPERWASLRQKYKKFYTEHGLNEARLNAQLLTLEQTNACEHEKIAKAYFEIANNAVQNITKEQKPITAAQVIEILRLISGGFFHLSKHYDLGSIKNNDQAIKKIYQSKWGIASNIIETLKQSISDIQNQPNVDLATTVLLLDSDSDACVVQVQYSSPSLFSQGHEPTQIINGIKIITALYEALSENNSPRPAIESSRA